ncbi:MAG: UDP-N-acetylglucosamine 2-epimerase (non-hydrolyzing) [Oscillospiraceae bacterium]|jgi:UDP-N-acetylglucosamine 2-epimerase (non-hydrolysing)|nr:UDP-N-acetylglucosamine 2-epimerase (non-hydrolyzing) [Oscillospiraceae bacterium]
MEPLRVLSVMGTRPEAIKMCPLVRALQNEPRIQALVCATGQHREMLAQAMALFDVKADWDLNVMQPGQTLTEVTTRVLSGMETVIREAKPDLVLVHGDTTTSMAAGLAAFYAGVPVGHVEAGLRTKSIKSPFPEELNRRLTGRIAQLHFAPTARAAENLAREDVTEGVFITGNTAIDALRYTVAPGYHFREAALNALPEGERWLLLTAHRREHWGEPLEQICRAARTLVDRFPDVRCLYPVHPNPVVQGTAQAVLGDHPRVTLLPPLDATDMHNLLSRATVVMTDSGGIQEEGPALGVPVIVLREETERPEAIAAGGAVLAGYRTENIVRIAGALLGDESARKAVRQQGSPFGDGHASEKIVAHILQNLRSAPSGD